MELYEAINARRTVRDFSDQPVERSVTERIITAGLKAPSNDHLRRWEFVVVNNRDKRTELLKAMIRLSSRPDVERWLDSWGAADETQRAMYLDAVPKQYAMLMNAGCLILPFFYHPGDLLAPESLSSLNGFASIWCCIENMLLAAASEGLYGVTRIPMNGESRHVKAVVNGPDGYVMPCYVALGYPAANAEAVRQKAILPCDRIHMEAW
jgi:nitroreductase